MVRLTATRHGTVALDNGRADSVAEPARVGNAHICVDRVRTVLRDELADVSTRVGEAVDVEPLGGLSDGVDATTKFLVRSRSMCPVAVVIVSRPAAPHLMARGTAAASRIRTLVGVELAEAIMTPIHDGAIDGCSFELMPWYPPIPNSPIAGRWQRFRLRRSLLDWLHRSTAAAVENGADESGSTAAEFDSMLEHLRSQSFADDRLQTLLDKAKVRLGSGQWRPRHTFDHNDFWLGNVLGRNAQTLGRKSRYPFILIDWAGANPRGFGCYDLVRLARSLKLSRTALSRELNRHATALQCDLVDLRGHLLAALGRLHQHLEHFPEESFVRLLGECVTTLEDAAQ